MEKIVKTLLQGLDARAKDILTGRFGLDGNASLTLAELGEKYNITRERVRQIEAFALNQSSKKMAESGASALAEKAARFIKEMGGVVNDGALVAELVKATPKAMSDAKSGNAVRFIMELSGKVMAHRGDDDYHPFWYLNEESKKKAENFVGQLVKVVRSSKDAMLRGASYDGVFAEAVKASKISEPVGKIYMGISRKFMTSPFGDFGLAEWPEINPKTARQWAYIVVKKESKPLHFTDIVAHINAYRKNKIANVQTVHNELIKDSRFVLVGRGMYGLQEFGILPGTAREVIAHFIKEKGPLRSADVVKFVLQKRFFKEGTIMINLQNKKYFKNIGNGTYDIREV